MQCLRVWPIVSLMNEKEESRWEESKGRIEASKNRWEEPKRRIEENRIARLIWTHCNPMQFTGLRIDWKTLWFSITEIPTIFHTAKLITSKHTIRWRVPPAQRQVWVCLIELISARDKVPMARWQLGEARWCIGLQSRRIYWMVFIGWYSLGSTSTGSYPLGTIHWIVSVSRLDSHIGNHITNQQSSMEKPTGAYWRYRS